jgi:TonB family protein
VLPDRNAKKKTAEKKPAPPREAPPETPAEPPAAPPEQPGTTGPAAAESATEPAPAADAPAVPGPAAPVAGGVHEGTGAAVGGGGEGTGGGGDAYTFYLALLKRNIENAWKRPVYTGDTTLTATVRLTLTRSGRVQRLEMKQPSGFEPLDRSLMQAVRAAEPFPPFPLALAMDSLSVQIVFDLTPEGADTGEPGD